MSYSIKKSVFTQDMSCRANSITDWSIPSRNARFRNSWRRVHRYKNRTKRRRESGAECAAHRLRSRKTQINGTMKRIVIGTATQGIVVLTLGCATALCAESCWNQVRYLHTDSGNKKCDGKQVCSAALICFQCSRANWQNNLGYVNAFPYCELPASHTRGFVRV